MNFIAKVKFSLNEIRLFLIKVLNGIWKIIKFACLNVVVRAPLLILWTIWPLLIVLIISYLSLNLMDQMQDLLDSLVQNPIYSLSAFASLLIFCLTTWYCTQILFILRNQQDLAEEHTLDGTPLTKHVVAIKRILNSNIPPLPSYATIDTTILKHFTFYTPIVLGMIPFFSLAWALKKIDNSGFHFSAIIILALIYIAITYRNRVFTINGVGSKSINGQALKSLLPSHKRLIRTFFYAMIILIFLASFKFTNILISSSLGPIAVIYLALTMWLIIASFFNYLDYRFQTPFTLICLFWMMIFNNNNHQIRTVETGGSYRKKDKNSTVANYFKSWLSNLEKSRKSGDKIMPVYLIATEGGGIRSAYWTAAVLRKLDSLSPNENFYKHVFAVSGVSGGSVGAVVYTAQHRDHLRNPHFKFDVNAFFDNDFLSPLLTAMLIPDLLQKFSPIGFSQLDRARYLEDSWESAYMDLNEQKFTADNQQNSYQPFGTLGQSFMSLWFSSGDNIRFQTPILFLNATLAETGRKGILTPLTISNDKNFDNVIDIQETVYRHIPLKTAASISARFPLVTPPATIEVVNESWKNAGNFVDGGYLDNSGTTTLLSILSSITYDDSIKSHMETRNIVFKIITINNSPEPVADNKEHPEALNGTYELSAPMQAFFKSWDNSADARQYAVREYLRGFSGSLNITSSSNSSNKTQRSRFIYDKPYNFNLDRRTGIIPLGWDLSISAEKRIREQAEGIVSLINNDKEYKNLFEGL